MQGVTVVSHASSAGGRLHATSTRKQLGDGEAKQRRVAYGSDVIKDELRKGTGGPQGAGPEQVGDSSEDDDEEASAVGRRDSITRYGAGTPLLNHHSDSSRTFNEQQQGFALCAWYAGTVAVKSKSSSEIQMV